MKMKEQVIVLFIFLLSKHDVAQDLSEFPTDGVSVKEELSEGELSEGEVKILMPEELKATSSITSSEERLKESREKRTSPKRHKSVEKVLSDLIIRLN